MSNVDLEIFKQASKAVRKGHADDESFIDDVLFNLNSLERGELSELIQSFGASAKLNESTTYTIDSNPSLIKRTIELMLRIGKYHSLEVDAHIDENGLNED